MLRNGLTRDFAIVVLCLLTSVIGCQRAIRNQVPKTQRYFIEDNQYWPAGSEFMLENQKKALEEYKLERERLRATLEEDDQ